MKLNYVLAAHLQSGDLLIKPKGRKGFENENKLFDAIKELSLEKYDIMTFVVEEAVDDNVLAFNEFAAEKEKEIARTMGREVRRAFKLNGGE